VQATTLVFSKEGGLGTLGGPRLINVGPYAGDTVAAQTLVLLHEFGHVLNLLPVDFDNENGKSMQNTAEVLRFCRPEVESKVRRSTFSATRRGDRELVSIRLDPGHETNGRVPTLLA